MRQVAVASTPGGGTAPLLGDLATTWFPPGFPNFPKYNQVVGRPGSRYKKLSKQPSSFTEWEHFVTKEFLPPADRHLVRTMPKFWESAGCVEAKETSDTNGRDTAIDSVNTAVPDLLQQ